MPGPTISATLVVHNEEQLIERCLRSFAGVVDETIVIHDGPCSDRTVEIASELGAQTLELEHVGHAERHRVRGYELASGDWILRLDADEFLSDALRAELRTLVGRDDVNGYRFVWPRWDGARYLTRDGPMRLALFRRDALHFVGRIQEIEQVDGPVLDSALRLEHQPTYNNYALRTVLRKYRRWARINARELLTPLDTFPAFNVRRPLAWSRRRHVLNALAPVLLPFYAAATLVLNVRANLAQHCTPLQALRFGLTDTTYVTFVQFYVAKYFWLDRAGRSASPADPAHVSAPGD